MSLFGKAGHRMRGRGRKRITRPAIELFEERMLLSTQQFLVTSTADKGTGSLRQAIKDANAAGQPSIIDFDIAGNGPYVISLATPLDTIQTQTLIDGTSQPGYAGTPLIQVDGHTLSSGDGLDLAAGSDGSRIRGLDIYGFSSGAAIHIQSTSDVVQGNYLGTNVQGTSAPHGNAGGIQVEGVSGATIGGTASVGNLISGNRIGILIQGSSGTSVTGNLIGTNAMGAPGLGNSTAGIRVVGSSNKIGSATAGMGNVITSNPIGVDVESGSRNPIIGNSIYANTQGIFLNSSNAANNSQAPPSLTYATSYGGTTVVDGQITGFAANAAFRVDFYASAVGDDTSTSGQAHIYLGSQSYTTDGSGNAPITFTSTVAVPVGQVITATATDPSGNTSQFANSPGFTSTTNAMVVGAFEVTTTSDRPGAQTGLTSLRQAILNVDADTANAIPDTISFRIPTSDSGYDPATNTWTTTPLTTLPVLTRPVILDGTTQPGYAGAPVIVIDGNGLAGDGLKLTATSSTVKGLDIIRFAGAANAAIDLEAGGDVVQADVLGIRPDGTAGPNAQGVLVNGSGNTIGGTSAAAGNVIASNAGAAVNVNSGSGDTIRSNLIYANGSAIVLHAGTNGGQLPPSLASATSSSGSTTISGTVPSPVAGTVLDFYADAPGKAPARTYLGSFTLPGADAAFTATLPVSVSTLVNIVATATSPAGNSSAFSTSVSVTNPFLVTSTADSGFGSLRQAIQNVNADTGNPNADTIAFAIGTVPAIITLSSDLPALSHKVIIDATTQPSYAGSPIVEIVGTSANSFGIELNAGGSTIKGLNIVNVVNGPAVDLESDGNTIQSDVLGLDLNGNAAGNAQGVLINGSGNTIGGTSAAAGNVIASNTGAAVGVNSGSGDTIRSNLIFSNGSAIVLQSQTNNGEQPPSLTSATTSGGTTTVEGSVSNSTPGGTILDFYADATGQSPARTYLGSVVISPASPGFPKFTATLPIPSTTGARITATSTSPTGDTSQFSSPPVTITNPFLVTNTNDGGVGSLRQALIAANANQAPATIVFSLTGGGQYVIHLASPLPAITNPVVLDATNLETAPAMPVVEIDGSALPSNNKGDGLQLLSGSQGSTISGLDFIHFTGNVPAAGPIPAHTADGIYVQSSGNVIQGNDIGVLPDGTTAAPNGGGILITGSNNSVGGTANGAANTIAFNLGPAVTVDTGTGDTILGNPIYGNGTSIGQSGIVLQNGGNDLLPSPTITGVTSVPGLTTVAVDLTGLPAGSYLIDFYVSAPGDSLGTQVQAHIPLPNGTQPTTVTAGSTLATFTFPTPTALTIVPAQLVTATATLTTPAAGYTAGDTSAFSNAATPVSPFNVTTTSDSGIGSLRQAIINADASGSAQKITFGLSAGSVILVGQGSPSPVALPSITVPVTINAPGITISGSTPNLTGDGLTLGLNSDGSSIQGVEIDGFRQSSVTGIGGNGVLILSGNDTIVGDTFLGNSFAGVQLTSSSSTQNVIQGDTFGSSGSGNRYGVLVVGASSNTIGGTASGQANTIGFSTTNGVAVLSGNGNPIRGNAFFGDASNQSSAAADIAIGPGANNNATAPILVAAAFDGVTTLNLEVQIPAGANLSLDVYLDLSPTQRLFLNSGQFSSGQFFAYQGSTYGQVTISLTTQQAAMIHVGKSQVVATSTDNTTNATSSFSNLIKVFDTTTVTTTLDDGVGSLRQVIKYVNGLNAPSNRIRFDIEDEQGGSAPFIIEPSKALPPITVPVVIDGTTEPSFATVLSPVVEIDGELIQASGTAGLTLASGSGGSSVLALSIYRFTGSGIDIQSNAVGNTTKGDLAAADWIGVSAFNNSIGLSSVGTNAIGVLIEPQAAGNTIGAQTIAISGGPATTNGQNKISGNSSAGIEIESTAGGNTVENNLIGLIRFDIGNKTEVFPTNGEGILIDNSPGNRIGLAGSTQNVISGNKRNGIHIEGMGATGNVIVNSYIGTDSTGTFSSSIIGNQLDGVFIDGASGNVVGGPSPAEVNLIGGNQKAGVSISGTVVESLVNAGGNTVINNRIGVGNTASSGSNPPIIANVADGIAISNSPMNSIGASVSGDVTTGYGNTVSGNLGSGISLAGSSSTSNLIAANQIGGSIGGQGNSGAGILVTDGFQEVIGGAPVLCSGGDEILQLGSLSNAIVGNSGNGIWIVYDSGVSPSSGGNLVQGNWISRNGQNGIEFQGVGSSPDEVQDNFIGLDSTGEQGQGNTLSGIQANGESKATISGNVISANGLSGITISNGAPTGVPAAVSIQDNRIGTNREGTAVSSIGSGRTLLPLGNLLDGIRLQDVSGVSIGGTSSGATVSLDLATSRGNLIGGNVGRGIELDTGATNDPIIGNLIGIVFQAATTEANCIPSAITPVDTYGTNAGNLSDGIFVFGAIGNTVASNLISNNRGYGIRASNFQGTAALDLSIRRNFIGTNNDGSAVSVNNLGLGNAADGIFLDSVSAVTVGGAFGQAGNVISGNRANGVDILASHDIRVVGNEIGTDLGGTASGLGNAANGIFLNGSNSISIGGLSPDDRNNVSGNFGSGLFLSGSNNNAIEGNDVGMGVGQNGISTVIPNAVVGIILSNADSNTLGGMTRQAGNLISGNSLDGILLVNDAIGNSISYNQIGVDPNGIGAVPNSADGIFLLGSNSNGVSIKGVVFNPTPGSITGNTIANNVISGNNQSGVEIFGSFAQGNTVSGNTIGLSRDGSFGVPNQGNGVYFNNAGPGNVIGAGNVLSGNAQSGVLIFGTAGAGGGEIVQGNKIGTDASGTVALANGGNGVFIYGTSNNSVSGNVISGNAQAGVAIFGPAVTAPAVNNSVLGNLIGVKSDGTQALPNLSDGVDIFSGQSNRIGQVGSPNVISGNRGNGILISTVSDISPDSNTISGNVIGLGSNGSSSVPNGRDGILVQNGEHNQIGVPGASPIPGTNVPSTPSNVISANGGSGVQFTGQAANNAVQGNYIGVGAGGTGSIGNTFAGVFVNDLSTSPSNELIGGSTPGAGNIIAGSAAGFGVDILGPAVPATGGNNIIQGNLIGIDRSSALAGNSIGIDIQNSADNLVGGSGSSRNVISANATAGVELTGLYSTRNTIEGNAIGTDITGNQRPGDVGALTPTFPAQYFGITITTPSVDAPGPNNVILQNVISGNLIGIDITGIGSGTGTGQGVPFGRNLIEGNKIGTDPTGMAPNPNFQYGIYIDNSAANTVGGSTPGSANLISANGIDGVEVFGGSPGSVASQKKSGAPAGRNYIVGNLIGVNATGATGFTHGGAEVKVPDGPTITIGEQLYGVVVIGSSSNVIGSQGVGNIIGGNIIAGVYITRQDFQGNSYSVPMDNTVSSNVIANNGIYGVYRFEAPNNLVAMRRQRHANKFRGNLIDLQDFTRSLNGNTQLSSPRSRFSHKQPLKTGKVAHPTGRAKHAARHRVAHSAPHPVHVHHAGHARAVALPRPRIPALFLPGTETIVIKHVPSHRSR